MREDSFPPNTNPHLFTLIAVAVGYACVGDLNANEQNSIGNWIIMVGQYVLTHAAQQQLIESRIENSNININSKRAKNGGSVYTDNNQNKSNQNQRGEVDMLIEAVRRMEKELENYKK